MKNFFKQFRPLTSEDVEVIRENQDNTKDIAVLLQKEIQINETMSLIVEILPQLNTSVEGYFIMNSSFSVKNRLPIIITKELYETYLIL